MRKICRKGNHRRGGSIELIVKATCEGVGEGHTPSYAVIPERKKGGLGRMGDCTVNNGITLMGGRVLVTQNAWVWEREPNGIRVGKCGGSWGGQVFVGKGFREEFRVCAGGWAGGNEWKEIKKKRGGCKWGKSYTLI